MFLTLFYHIEAIITRKSGTKRKNKVFAIIPGFKSEVFSLILIMIFGEQGDFGIQVIERHIAARRTD